MAEEKKTTEEKKMERTFSGVVVSAKGDKTIVVEVERKLRHKLYDKLYSRTRKFHVHDEHNTYKEGDVVEFVGCRPMSKKKRWRVISSSNDTK